MPSKSVKQAEFMAAAAKNPQFAKKAGISQSVAKEFHEADVTGPSGNRHLKLLEQHGLHRRKKGD